MTANMQPRELEATRGYAADLATGRYGQEALGAGDTIENLCDHIEQVQRERNDAVRALKKLYEGTLKHSRELDTRLKATEAYLPLSATEKAVTVLRRHEEADRPALAEPMNPAAGPAPIEHDTDFTQ